MRRTRSTSSAVVGLCTPRFGASAVELAVVLPVMVFFLMGSLEVGRAVMVRHVLEETARAGCRVAVFENGTKEDVLNIVATSMKAAAIANYVVTVSPDPPENLKAFEAVTVTVSVAYNDASWFPASFMSKSTLFGICVMPAEGDGATNPDSGTTPTTKKNKKADAKKTNAKKTNAKKTNAKKTNAKKTDAKKTDAKKAKEAKK